MSRSHFIARKPMAARREDLRRIAEALEAAACLLRFPSRGALQVEQKQRGEPVTSGERAVDALLFKLLVRSGEGWLSEESKDDRSRLGKQRVWVVDPLDGTREYISGIPEWSISIGLIEEGQAVAGGVYNPAKDELFLGSLETNLTAMGKYSGMRNRSTGNGIVVLASRSEVNRGEWDDFRKDAFTLRPVGSVAYKLALVASGAADATWTLVPKHEWDVAAGVALVLAAQGRVSTLQGAAPVFNRPEPRFEGLVAVARGGHKRLRACLAGDGAAGGRAGRILTRCL